MPGGLCPRLPNTPLAGKQTLALSWGHPGLEKRHQGLPMDPLGTPQASLMDTRHWVPCPPLRGAAQNTECSVCGPLTSLGSRAGLFQSPPG